jgi:hypothetical protein
LIGLLNNLSHSQSSILSLLRIAAEVVLKTFDYGAATYLKPNSSMQVVVVLDLHSFAYQTHGQFWKNIIGLHLQTVTSPPS